MGRQIFERPRGFALLLALALLVGGCGVPAGPAEGERRAEAPKPARPARITAAVAGDPPSLYPALNPAGAARGVESLTDLVNAGLSIVDNQGSLRPQLAEAVPSVENGLWRVFSDGRMETTWRIKESVLWHDGAPFTAEDLVFTTQVGRDAETAVFGHIAYNSFDSITMPDSRTVTVQWRRPYIEANAMFTRGLALPMPRHALQQAYEESRSTFTDLPYWSVEFIGTGPYKVRELVRGSHLTLDANDLYILGRPRIDVVEIRFILDPNALTANVLAGAVDVALGRAVSLEQALAVRDQWRDGKLDIAPSNAIQIHPQFLEPQPLVVGDVRFRRAVLHAINRQELIDAFFSGQTSIAHAWVNDGDPFYKNLEGSIVRYDYDQRRTAQLIEELGYVKDPEGFYRPDLSGRPDFAGRDRGGERLAVEIRTSTPSQTQIQAMFAVADMLQRAGVSVEPVVIPPQRAQDLPYRAAFPAFEMLRGGSDLKSFGVLHSRAARLPENNFRGVGGTNYARYMSRELDGLIERYFATIPVADRVRLAGEVLHHVTDQLVVMPLLWDVEVALISNRLVNIAARHKDSSNAWNAHEWDVVR